MKVEFDESKSDKNARERGLPFEIVHIFDFSTAVVREDVRKDYPERRFVAVGYIGERLHVMCFTPVRGGIRVISLRKANEKEVRAYEEEETH
jgi:uncharacterized protein